MDNEAFRALVNAGSKGTGTGSGSSSGNNKNKNNKKTTKEIAREAVEEEFRLIKKNKEKNKRKHKQKYDDDEDDDDGYFSKPQKKKKASLSDDDNQHDIDDDGGDPNDDIGNNKGKRIQYRDRAKERRKGIVNKDYESTDTSKNKNLSAEMTKYLGGDEQHTHLVRGLDYALADKVRREQKAQRRTINSIEDQKQNDNSNLKERKDTRNNDNISGDGDGENDKTLSKEEKNQKLKSLAHQQILNSMSNGGHRNSDLCQPIISYYFHKFTSNNKNKKSTNKISLAGQSIQRSSLKFLASNNNIHNKKLAWEIPRENISFSSTTTSSSSSSQASSVFFRGHTFLDQDLIERIIQAQDKIKGKNQKAGSSSVGNSKHGVYRSEQDEARKSDPANAKINESDDDSDIFEDLDDYVPS